MVDGIRTIDLPLKSTASEFICNTDIGAGPEGPVRVKTLHLAALMAIDGGLAFGTWAALNAVIGTTVGERAEVYGDAGTHTDPVVGGVKQNSGVYSWSASPAGWEWISADSSLRGTTIHATSGVPANTLGTDGDWAIYPLTYELWGPKAGGVWPAGSVGAAAAAAQAANAAAAADADRLAADASAAAAAADAALVAAALAAAQLSTVPFIAGNAAIKGGRLRFATQCYDTEFEVIAGHILNANPLVDLRAGRLRVVAQERRLAKQFVYPSGYTGKVIPIYLRDDGVPTTPYDFDYTFRPAFMATTLTPGVAGNKILWVSNISGSDLNDGLTPATAKATFAAAMITAGVFIIMVEGSRTAYQWSHPLGKSINVIGYGAVKPRFFFPQPGFIPALSLSAGYTNVYEVTATADLERPCSPFVEDEYGVPLGYKEVYSKDLVSQTPMSFWYTGAGTKTMYVHSSYLPVPGTDIYLTIQNQGNGVFRTADNNAGHIVYLENLIFTHCLEALSNTGGNLHAMNCAFIGSENFLLPPFLSIGLGDTILKGCVAAYSGTDAFNVQTGDNHVEIDCIAYGNGNQAGSSQASTMHDTVDALRIRGEYENNALGAILDVGSGKTINIGCKFKGTTSVFCVGADATREIWNYDCEVAGTGVHYEARGTSTIHVDGKVRGLILGGANAAAGITMGPELFTPRSLSGLKLWLDSADPTTITIATGVSQWKDKSGWNNHALQATGSKQPPISAAALNGIDTLSFASASSQLLDLTSPITRLATDEWTVICVAKRAAAAADIVVSLGSADNGSAAGRATYLAADSKLYAYSPGKEAASTAATYGDAAAYHWHAVRHAPPDAFDLFYDSATPVTDTESAVATVGTWSHVGAALGATDFYSNGAIAEIIYVDRALTNAEMTLVDTYLANKYMI